jgi:dihydropteroate synthase
MVVGVSRKSFLTKLDGGGEKGDRLMPTVVLTAVLRARGAEVFRVHDVAENVRALRVSETMLAR